MLSVCLPQNHFPALKNNKPQLYAEAPCGIDGMMNFWNSQNIGYKQYQ